MPVAPLHHMDKIPLVVRLSLVRLLDGCNNVVLAAVLVDVSIGWVTPRMGDSCMVANFDGVPEICNSGKTIDVGDVPTKGGFIGDEERPFIDLNQLKDCVTHGVMPFRVPVEPVPTVRGVRENSTNPMP